MIPEKAIQAQILALLRLRGVWHHRNNTGAAVQESGGTRRFMRFGAPGMPDITCYLPQGNVLWIEVKAQRGRLNEAQTEWRSKAHEHGHHHLVARSVEDVEAALRLFGYGVN